ncbi:uncharacterized protein LOC111376735 [Olea europaea var. sylvestris]|uniref:uncharacterized protein LOC111376735 n=1 Tax=Olea europaea var. sylvestris TaxID=158386 RepID=UPI000C1CD4E0|nr:uncharacterized protein LOC111376735 [Olea europaea var. sylvestris]
MALKFYLTTTLASLRQSSTRPHDPFLSENIVRHNTPTFLRNFLRIPISLRISPSEVAGGSSSWPAWQVDLGKCMATVGLVDLKFDGCLYTWSNKHVSDPTLEKLDRVLVNSKWEEKFSGSSATFRTAGVSDHSPMVVKVAELPRRKIPSPFFDYWMDHSDFFPLVAQVWGETVLGTPMFCLCSKLKKLKLALKNFNKEHFSELPTRFTHARTDIEHVLCLIQQSPLDSSLHREESRLQKELCKLSRAEEGFLRQKAHVKWLNLGDQNTAFFFKAMKSHYGKSKVVSICKDDGTRVEEPHEVSEAIVAFYQNLLGQQPTGESLDTNLLRKALPKSISAVQNENLDRDVSFKEIKEVLFSLKDNKAPGPDGFNAGFLKRTWNIVGNDVLSAIKSFFDSRKLLKQVNATTITLVPKVPNPSQVKEFRPISCCNSIYKSIAKLIADRVKMVLPDIVGPQQIAFVKVLMVLGFPERVVRWITHVSLPLDFRFPLMGNCMDSLLVGEV